MGCVTAGREVVRCGGECGLQTGEGIGRRHVHLPKKSDDGTDACWLKRDPNGIPGGISGPVVTGSAPLELPS